MVDLRRRSDAVWQGDGNADGLGSPCSHTLEALEEAFTYIKGIPQVPGGYYSWRNVNNAFYTVTTETDTATPREELMDKINYVNAEINHKRQELGLPLAQD